MVKIVKDTGNELRILIDKGKFSDEIDKVYKLAEKKFKNYTFSWDGDMIIVKEMPLRKCDVCGKFDVIEFEYEDGERVYKICASCFVRLNS
jgi:YgiT-type zinc finger domain-containing protein